MVVPQGDNDVGEGLSTTARRWTTRQRRTSRERLSAARSVPLRDCSDGTAHENRTRSHLSAGKSLADTASSFAQIGTIAPADACRRSARSFNALAASPDVGFETLQRPRPSVSSTSGNSRDATGVQSLTSRRIARAAGVRELASALASVMVAKCDGVPCAAVCAHCRRAGSSVRVAQDGCQETDARRRMPGGGRWRSRVCCLSIALSRAQNFALHGRAALRHACAGLDVEGLPSHDYRH